MSDKAAADTTLLQALRALASDAEARATLGRLADALDEGVAEARLALQVAAGCFEGHTSIELHGPLSSLEPIAGLTGLESITLNSAGRGCDLAALAGLPTLRVLRIEADYVDPAPLVVMEALETLEIEGATPAPPSSSMSGKKPIRFYRAQIAEALGKRPTRTRQEEGWLKQAKGAGLLDAVAPKKMVKGGRKALATLRKMLKSDDVDILHQAYELMTALGDQAILETLAAGSLIDGDGHLVPGPEVLKRTKADHRARVALMVLEASGALAEVRRLDLEHLQIDLAVLSGAKALRCLTLNCTGDMGFLADLPHLEHFSRSTYYQHAPWFDTLPLRGGPLAECAGLTRGVSVVDGRLTRQLPQPEHPCDGFAGEAVELTGFQAVCAIVAHGARGTTALADLRHLDLGSTLKDLTAVAHLEQLTSLTVSGLEAVAGAERLVNLKHLEHLRSKVTDWRPLQRESALETVYLSGDYGRGTNRSATDLGWLGHHPGVKQLDLRQFSADYSVLGTLAELEVLEMHDCTQTNTASAPTPLHDITWLEGNARLKRLVIPNAAVSDLRSLTGLVELEAVRLAHWRLDAYSKGASVIAGRAVSDLSPLAHATGLTELVLVAGSRLSGPLNSLTPIQHLTALEKLVLGSTNNEITDLNAFAELTGLKTLVLYGFDKIEHVDALGALTHLETLALTGATSLVDTSALAGCTALKKLDLTRCTGLPKAWAKTWWERDIPDLLRRMGKRRRRK